MDKEDEEGSRMVNVVKSLTITVQKKVILVQESTRVDVFEEVLSFCTKLSYCT